MTTRHATILCGLLVLAISCRAISATGPAVDVSCRPPREAVEVRGHEGVHGVDQERVVQIQQERSHHVREYMAVSGVRWRP